MVSCETVNVESITVPTLEADITKPTLVTIPEMSIQGFNTEQIDNIVSVLSAYNTNLNLLLDYSKRLERYNKACIDYYEGVVKSLTEK